MEKKTEKIVGISGAVFILLIVVLLIAKSKKKKSVNTIKNVNNPALKSGTATTVKAAVIAPKAGTPITSILLTQANRNMAATQNSLTVNKYMPFATTRQDADDIANAIAILFCSLPRNNTDIAALTTMVNNCCNVTAVKSQYSPICYSPEMGAAIDAIDPMHGATGGNGAYGVAGAFSDAGAIAIEAMTGIITADTTDTISIDTHTFLGTLTKKVISFVSSATATAKTESITINNDLNFTFQSLLNEYLPQIKANLSRVNTILDVTNFTDIINTLYPKIQNLNRNKTISFTDAATQLVTLDRWIRALVVYQAVTIVDAKKQPQFKQSWYAIRAQVLDNVNIKQLPLMSTGTYGNNQPVPPFVYFNDVESINILNAIYSTIAPSQQQIAEANALAQQQQDAQTQQGIAIASKVALVVISMII